MPPGFFLENTSLRLQSEVKLILANILHLSPAVHPSMHVSVSVCACMHVSSSAGPEVAVLDWYSPEADPVYWRRGGEGVWWQDFR